SRDSLSATSLPSTSLHFFFFTMPPPPISTLFPYTTLFRSVRHERVADGGRELHEPRAAGLHRHPLGHVARVERPGVDHLRAVGVDRKSTRLNSSHVKISYAVFCLKKKKKIKEIATPTTYNI